jgi:hypothetical protein
MSLAVPLPLLRAHSPIDLPNQRGDTLPVSGTGVGHKVGSRPIVPIFLVIAARHPQGTTNHSYLELPSVIYL